MPVIDSTAVFTAGGVQVGVSGRLGRYGGTTTGPLGETTGLFESDAGLVGVGTTTPIAIFHSVSTTGVASAAFHQVLGPGTGHGAANLVAGSGIGSGSVNIVSGSGNGDGSISYVSGAGSGSGARNYISGGGAGHGTWSSVDGGGNGHGIYTTVGSQSGSTGTGSALNAIAFDAPGTASHPSAIQATVVAATAFAGYFNGNVHATGTVTSSDKRIKSDFQPVTPELRETVGRLKIQTYYKHLDGRVDDEVNGQRIDRLRDRVVAIDAMAESDKAAAATERAEAVAEIAKFDSEDWLKVQGSRIPGRLAGVIAQDVEAAAPEYVTKAGKPFKHGDDLEPIRTVNDPSILYIMIETLRHDMAKLSAEFANYRATHP